MNDDEMVELVLDVENETEAAYLLTDGDHKGWVAKSLVRLSDDRDQPRGNQGKTFLVPYWVAERNGWV